MRELERRVLLSVLDRKWREHLYEMDYLREGIYLRAYSQRDPLVEYQREGFDMFAAMMDGIKEETVPGRRARRRRAARRCGAGQPLGRAAELAPATASRITRALSLCQRLVCRWAWWAAGGAGCHRAPRRTGSSCTGRAQPQPGRQRHTMMALATAATRSAVRELTPRHAATGP